MEGFIAVLNGTDDDYYYTSRQYQGFNIHVFNSISYPDISSSGFAQTIVSPGTEFFLRLDVSSVIAEPTISKYSIEQVIKFYIFVFISNCESHMYIFNPIYLEKMPLF